MPGMHRKLGRIGGHRRAMLRNLVTSTLREERIETTVTRAKEVNRVVEHMITLAKRGDLAARRQALAYVLDEDVVTKLFTSIGPRYSTRSGGYTRIMRTGFRRGDAAPMAILELV
ncbi:MAG: 50S ribosomal protein L17 [Sulfobacillus thermosulfidooxidans]|uniref:Large ribosomal subunit protein bL17 n=2 Tax=Sulfobacillus thermotolerans TaxID=338644 RepID=A0ABM6RNM4_9FIRM|nr:50S ribosomal protein L17 [Sulfobacillus sp. hq2]AUW92966.1 50S ribosomal protein L17 [Sulfobacillus thermotolerans]MCY0907109.1 50S ribosomal protein L17 [Sulfobacillus thermotolerans]POB11171.1 50S ribosomal protein L17 [Sulfobacillus sp. hq2]PSR37212.1 MAG: 50S ribosomal protein L17 [Sulfobacillus thermosulfidooxidans]